MASGKDVAQKREAVKGAYFGPGWKKKVDKMSDEQVIAVYLRLKNQQKI